MPAFHTKTIHAILDPVAQQVGSLVITILHSGILIPYFCSQSVKCQRCHGCAFCGFGMQRLERRSVPTLLWKDSKALCGDQGIVRGAVCTDRVKECVCRNVVLP